MRVLLDTNILLDIIEGLQKFLLASSNVFDLGVRDKYRCLPLHSLLPTVSIRPAKMWAMNGQ